MINLCLLQSIFCGRGGIVFWADLVGAKHIYNSLKKWTQLYGNFYKPSRYLEERATKGIPLVRQKCSSLLSPLCTKSSLKTKLCLKGFEHHRHVMKTHICMSLISDHQ